MPGATRSLISTKSRVIARRCEAEGGMKVEFTDYILNLWQKIGYSPNNLDLSEILENELDTAAPAVTINQ